jgi:hypothetical protein
VRSGETVINIHTLWGNGVPKGGVSGLWRKDYFPYIDLADFIELRFTQFDQVVLTGTNHYRTVSKQLA